MKKLAWCVLSVYVLHTAGFAHAASNLPSGHESVLGDATYSLGADGYSATLTTTSMTSISNWHGGFDIGAGYGVLVQMPGGGVHLSRDISQDPSQIFGTLNVPQGQFFLSNPNGILFGPGSQVNAPGLVAAALEISDDDFAAGRYAFGGSGGYLLNQGNIHAENFVVLLGRAVANEGSVTSGGGAIELAAAGAATVALDGQGLVSVKLDAAVDQTVYDSEGRRVTDGAANAGLLQSDGGFVVISASALEDVYDNVINHTGVIEARTVGTENGVVVLGGGDAGVVRVEGDIDVSGLDAGETGGTVHVLGDKAGLFGDARIDARGDAGGGTVLVGGDERGLNADVQNASAIYLGESTQIDASAVRAGDGGKIVAFAEGTARIYGALAARGGAESGDGGFVETSGKEYFEILRTPDITAPAGLGGHWLIDPHNLTIVTGGGNTNINGSSPFVTTGDSAQLGISLIQAGLNGGGTVTITTANGGTQDGDINWNAALDFNGSGAATLNLDADGDINFNAAIFDSTPTAADSLTMDLDAGGDILFAASLSTEGGNLTADAGGTITVSGAISSTGDVDLAATGDMLLNAAISTKAVSGGVSGSNEALESGSVILTSTSGKITGGTGGTVQTGDATVNGAAGGADAATSGSITLSAAGEIRLAAADALATGDASVTNNSNDTAQSGMIDITTADKISSDGATGRADISLGAATGGTNLVFGEFQAVTNGGSGSAGGIYVTSGEKIYLGDVSAGGDIDVRLTTTDGMIEFLSGAAVLSGGNQTYTADKMKILAMVTASTGTVTLKPNAGQAIALGGASDTISNTLELGDAEFDTITASQITVGGSDSGAMTLNAAITPGGTSTLRLVSGSTITQSTGPLTVANLAAEAAGAITLAAASNDADQIAMSSSSGNIQFSDADALAVGTAAGLTGVTAANGDVTIQATNNLTIGQVNASGTATLRTTNGGDDIVDSDGTGLNVIAQTIVFDTNGAGADVGTSADPIEIRGASDTTSVGGTAYVTVVPAATATTTGGVTVENGRVTGGENYTQYTSDASEASSSTDEAGDSEEEDEEDGDSPQAFSGENVSAAGPAIEPPATEPASTPPLSAATLNPCAA